MPSNATVERELALRNSGIWTMSETGGVLRLRREANTLVITTADVLHRLSTSGPGGKTGRAPALVSSNAGDVHFRLGDQN